MKKLEWHKTLIGKKWRKVLVCIYCDFKIDANMPDYKLKEQFKMHDAICEERQRHQRFVKELLVDYCGWNKIKQSVKKKKRGKK